MQKLRLEMFRVESFATQDAPPALGMMQANTGSGVLCNLTYNGCPTQYCTPPAGATG